MQLLVVNIGDPTVFSPSGSFSTFGDLVSVVVKNAFVLAGILSFFLLIFGGFSIIMSAGGGDAKKLEQGKKAMTGAVMGLIIIVGSIWLVQILEKVTGIGILSPTIQP